jgi:hypothetical protein
MLFFITVVKPAGTDQFTTEYDFEENNGDFVGANESINAYSTTQSHLRLTSPSPAQSRSAAVPQLLRR